MNINSHDDPSASHELPGNYVGSYQLLEQLGAGGMAEVWRARHDTSGGACKIVAIKLLASHLGCSLSYRRLFQDEARLSMMLSHSNIVQVFDVGHHDERCFMAMEWVDGMDLAHLIRRIADEGEQLPIPIIAYVIGEMLHGLAYAHGLIEGDAREAVVHRDISPHNVLVSVSGEVKIGDFGIARLASEDTSGVHIRGKLRYMPPEQAAGESRHPSVDLFAVGAVLQELLDGDRFRSGLARDELFGKVLSGHIPPLQRSEVPEALLRLRVGLLEPDAERRLQTASAALEILRSCPEYGDAREWLADVVRAQCGVEAPRSGLSVDPYGPRNLSDLDTKQISTSRSVQAMTFEVPGSTSNSLSRDLITDSRLTVPGPAEERPRTRRVGLWIGLGGLGLGLGLSLTALAFSPRAEPAAAPTAERRPAPDTGSPPPPSPTDAEAADGAASLDGDDPSADPADAEAPATVEPEAKPAEPRSKRRAKPKPSKVCFKVGRFNTVDVKLDGGEVHRVGRPKLIDLRPGKHELSFRPEGSGPWIDGGPIRVRANTDYVVQFSAAAPRVREGDC